MNRATTITMSLLNDKLTAAENSGKKSVYIYRFNKRKAGKLTEVPSEWQMAACHICYFSASSTSKGKYASLSKDQIWDGGACYSNHTGLKRTADGFEVYNKGNDVGINGFIVFTK